MTTIEKVAKALYEARGGSWTWLEDKQSWMGVARCAIAALRDLPDDPGPRYTAGEYSRRNMEAFVADAIGE